MCRKPAVCIEFRKLGINAYSCDLQESSGKHHDWHFKKDIFSIIDNCGGITETGKSIKVDKWDCMIAFPPCTHLAVSGAAWFAQKRKDGRQQQGIDFFFENCKCEYKTYLHRKSSRYNE